MAMKNSYISFLLLILTGTAYGQALSGSYTIPSASYPTITSAVLALQLNGVAGPVTFTIEPGTYTEPNIEVKKINGTSAINTVKFRSKSLNAKSVQLLIGSGTPYIQVKNFSVNLISTDFIHFEYLTVVPTGPNTDKGFVVSGSSNCIITGCVVEMDTVNQTNFLGRVGIEVKDGSHHVIAGNVLNGGGIKVEGTNNITLNQNTINTVSYTSMILSNSDSAIITGNRIRWLSEPGIVIGSGFGLSYTSSLGYSSISGNHISGFGQGLQLDKIMNNALVSNNVITECKHGMSINQSERIKVIHNSVYADEVVLSIDGQESSTQLDIQNNIFTTFTDGYVYRISNIAAIATLDYNNSYTSNCDRFASAGGQDISSLAAWQALFPFDNSSLSVKPEFRSSYDLHLFQYKLKGKGVAHPDVVKDIDGQMRDPQFPDIGADEFALHNHDIRIDGLVTHHLNKGQNNFSIVLMNNGTSSLHGKTVTLTYSIDGGAYIAPEIYTINGLHNTGDLLTYTFSTPLAVNRHDHYLLKAAVTLVSDPNTINDTLNMICSTILKGGTFTVNNDPGATTDFTSLAKGVELLNRTSCLLKLEGPIVFSIDTGVYVESVQLNRIQSTSDTNTVTFRSANGDALKTIIRQTEDTINLNVFTIKLNEAEHVYLKDISIENMAPVSAYSLWLNKTAHIHISNCYFRTGNFVSNTPTPLSNGLVNIQDGASRNLFIDNCHFEGGTHAIFLIGTNMATLTSNKIFGAQFSGITARNSANLTLINNTLSRFRPALNNLAYGFFLYENKQVRLLNNSLDYAVASADPSRYPSYGLYAYTANTSDQELLLLNNIISNTGMGYSLFVSSPGMLIRSDYNNLYTTGSFLAKSGSSNITNFNQWKITSGYDSASVSVDPAFTDSLLHTLNPALDKKGLLLTEVSHDADNEPRDPFTPDIGADEFILDLSDLAILNVEPSSAQLGPNTVNVKLINLGLKSLVDSSVQLSYSIDNGISWSAPENFISKALKLPNSTEDFSFKKTWDISQYDIYRLKVRINSPGLHSDVYKENDTLEKTVCMKLPAGSYTLGSPAADFSSLNQAANLLNQSECGIDGAVVFKILPGIYSEAVTFEPITGASAVHTITFESSTGKANDVLIRSGNNLVNDHHSIRLNGTDHITFRNLSIENTNMEFASGFHLTNGADTNTIENCTIILDSLSQFSSAYGILISGISSPDDPGSGKHNHFSRNTIRHGSWGIHLVGNISGNTGTIISKNVIAGTGMAGIWVENGRFTDISKNRVLMRDNIFGTGIYLGSGAGSLIHANELKNVGLNGIYVQNTQADRVLIANNFISGGSVSDLEVNGIQLYQCKNIDVLHNSVNLTQPLDASYALYANQTTDMRFLNNIFANTGGGYAYYIQGQANIQSNFNNYYATGPNLAYWDQDIADLPGLKAANKMDSASLALIPNFTAPDNLHLLNPALNNKGTALQEVPADFDSEIRDFFTPDMGADEYSIGTDGALQAWVTPSENAVLNNPTPVEVQVSNAGNVPLSGFLISYRANSVLQASETFTGTIQPGESAVYTFSQPWNPIAGAYELCAYTTISGDVSNMNDSSCIQVSKQTTGIENGANLSEIHIYPNPAENLLFISFKKQNTPVTIRLYTPLGVIVSETAMIADEKILLYLDKVPAGIYLLHIDSEEQTFTHKIQVIK